MGRKFPFFPSVIACAAAVLLFCARAALAQDTSEDRYGFIPLPPLTRLTPPGTTAAPPPQQEYAPVSQNFPPVRLPPQEFTPPAYGFAQPDYYAPDSGIRSDYILGPGDRLHVRVFDEDDLSGEFEIDGSGQVRLPLIGTLRAAGYTAPVLENSIAGAFARGYLKNPRVTVEITRFRPITILGAVNRPGEYPYANSMNALSAVALGGGFSARARESTVYILHEGSTVEEALPADRMTRIWPGDVVRIKDTLFWDALNIF